MSINWIQFENLKPYEYGTGFADKSVLETQRLARLKKTENEQGDAALLAKRENAKKIAHKYYQKGPDYQQVEVTAEMIMSSPVVTFQSDQSIEDLMQLKENFEFHHYPILEQGRLVGMISDRLLLSSFQEKKNTYELKCQDLMSRCFLTASRKTTVNLLGQLMIKEHLRCLPVINEEREIEGIITSSDILESIFLHAGFNIVG